MSLPVHVLNNSIIADGDMSASINSTPTNINEVVSYCIQAVFTGSPVGSLKIQASNSLLIDSNTVWTDVDNSSSAVTAAGDYMVNVELPSYSWVRLVYTRISGSGTINARINAKRR